MGQYAKRTASLHSMFQSTILSQIQHYPPMITFKDFSE